MELHTVHARILGKCNRVRHRIENSGGWHIHCELPTGIRIDLLDLFLVDHPHALDTILLPDHLVL